MEYITIGEIGELVTTGTITGARGISWDNGTTSAPLDSKGIPLLEIIWDEVFFFDANWSLKNLFSSINFNYSEDWVSISRLNMLFVTSIPFSIHSIVYSFELRSSFALHITVFKLISN